MDHLVTCCKLVCRVKPGKSLAGFGDVVRNCATKDMLSIVAWWTVA